MLDADAWIKRAEEVMASPKPGNWNYSEEMQFATSMIAAFYGPDSPQMKTFRENVEGIRKSRTSDTQQRFELSHLSNGTIRDLKAAIQAGLIKSVRVLLCGEIIAELLALAKAICADHSEAAKNVSSVLVAAAFEDIIRRMGADFAGVTTRPKLEEVITTLKQKDVLRGGEVTTALGT